MIIDNRLLTFEGHAGNPVNWT